MEPINNPNSFKNPASSGIFNLPILLLVILFSFNTAKAQAIAKVDDAKKNFGMVKKGEVIDMNYTITNVGTEPLIIQKTEVECSCTTVTFDDKPVLPGQSTIINVKFDTKSVYDRQDRIVKVFSNNKKGEFNLRFKGFVQKKKP